MADRDRFGGAVNSDASYFRDTDGSVPYHVREGTHCPRCGGFECWIPGQTAVLPTLMSCLGCGHTDAVGAFTGERAPSFGGPPGPFTGEAPQTWTRRE